MAETSPPTGVERFASLVSGGVLLLLAVSLWGWGVRLGVAGLRETAGWPPGVTQALLAASVISAVAGFGAWRMLRLAFIEGRPIGKAIVILFALVTVAGVVMSLM